MWKILGIGFERFLDAAGWVHDWPWVAALIAVLLLAVTILGTIVAVMI